MRHSTLALNMAATGTAILFIALASIAPSLVSHLEPWILAASIVLVGIPHGALDHLISARLFEQGARLRDHLLFYGWYLLLMAILSGMWFWIPDAGMLLFLSISVIHFGQADMEGFIDRDVALEGVNAERTGPDHRVALGAWLRWGASLSRGLMIIGLIVASHPDQSLTIIGEALRDESPLLGLLSAHLVSIKWGVLAMQGVFMVLLAAVSSLKPETKAAYVLDSLLIAVMFLALPPLLSFAIYFALWHSLGHIQEIRDYFNESGISLSVIGFYGKALPFTLVSFAGLAGLLWITRSFSLGNQIISLTFVLISVLTLPHMIVAHKMLRREKKEA